MTTSMNNNNNIHHDSTNNDNNSNNNNHNLSIRIGSRQVSPALPLIDATHASQTSMVEQTFQTRLSNYASHHIPLESKQGRQLRERVLSNMKIVCRAWIRHVIQNTHNPNLNLHNQNQEYKDPNQEDWVSHAGGQLYTSGSYRLGIHEPGADIDAVLVAPHACTRQDFFGSGYTPPDDILDEFFELNSNLNSTSNGSEEDQHNQQQQQQERARSLLLEKIRDPNSLAERIRNHPSVTNFVPVENAAVPILTFDWDGVNIDLLFARLNSPTVPPHLDIDDDAVLDGVDPATEKSLNGPRVTNLIAALMSGTLQRYRNYLQVVRCVRKWAKAKGLYSNKMGYWGGVNINICVALVVQLYPNASPASLLRKFFLVFKNWRWPNPVMLTRPHDARLGLTVWTMPHAIAGAGGMGGGMGRQVAPIITPAYPAMNSAASVSRQTLRVMQEEIHRGHALLDGIWKKHQQYYRDNNHNHNPIPDPEGHEFHELFAPSDFFINYSHYLSLNLCARTEEDVQSWMGFVESRLRKLVSDYMMMTGHHHKASSSSSSSLPISKLQLWPKKIPICLVDRDALLDSSQRKHSYVYFIGMQMDPSRVLRRLRDHAHGGAGSAAGNTAGGAGNAGTTSGSNLPSPPYVLDLDPAMRQFRNIELSKFQPLLEGMDVFPRVFPVKELPRIVFEDMYEAGVVEEELKSQLQQSQQSQSQTVTRVVHPKIVAMKKRRRLADADPKRLEMKRLAKLAGLKRKLEEMQKRKKEKGGNVGNDNENKNENENGDGIIATDQNENKMDSKELNHDHDHDNMVKKEDEKDITTTATTTTTTTTSTPSTTTQEDTSTNDNQIEEEEEALLESALDSIQKNNDKVAQQSQQQQQQDDDDDNNKDKDKDKDMYYSSEDEFYGPNGARKITSSTKEGNENNDDDKNNNIMNQTPKKTRAQLDAELLKSSGYNVVSSDEGGGTNGISNNDSYKVIGGNMIHPWRRPERVWMVEEVEEEEEEDSENDDKEKNDHDGARKPKKEGNTSKKHTTTTTTTLTNPTKMEVKFCTNFDVVELDSQGYIVDKGDDDFQPSITWIGRKPGFEFKLGERGVGYYRTGKKVVVPSNIAY